MVFRFQNTQSLHPICVDSFLQMWRQTLIQVIRYYPCIYQLLWKYKTRIEYFKY